METRAIVVTGAARGLGRSMASALAQAGHRVLAVDRDASELSELAREASGTVQPFAVDLTADSAADDVVAACNKHFGPVEGLINCAGIGQETISADFVTQPVRFWTVDDRHWRRIFAINIDAAFRLCRAVTPGMVERRFGRLICVTTSLETMIRIGMVPYGPTKAALEAMAAVMAKDLEGTGVTSNVLVPGGPAATRMMPGVPEPMRSQLVQPDTMRAPAVWLMSEASAGINGRRFRANAWDADLPGDEAAQRAGAPIAWQGLAGGAATVPGRS